DIVDASLRGELPAGFALQGGPIAFALGATYRKESGDQTSDAVSQARVDCTGVRGCPASLIGRQGGYLTFDPQPFRGSFSVKEGFVELGVPIFKDLPFANSLEVNASGRVADYSLSGTVWSWKAGATYRPIRDLLLRVTRSRDTRAPNLLELFNPSAITSGTIVYQGASVPQFADRRRPVRHRRTGAVACQLPRHLHARRLQRHGLGTLCERRQV
ncbi:MAG: TonB-dependent receptor, partial [Sphingomonas sp.]